MNQVYGDVSVQPDGSLRAWVKVDGREVNYMVFPYNKMREAEKWLAKAIEMEHRDSSKSKR